MKEPPLRKKRNPLILVVFLFLVFYLLFSLVKSLSNSLFFQSTARINVVLYDKFPVFYSLDPEKSVDYYVIFYPDLKMQVPGGYGSYRTGALGKLVSLEKKPEILRNTFSYATSSFVDFYFYPKTNDVFWGKKEDEELHFPSWGQIMFDNSNANFMDRLYFLILFSQKRPQYVRAIQDLKEQDRHGEMVFSEDQFAKEYLGFFYQNDLREEKKNVQLLYKDDYYTASRISDLLEGNGIRVSDLTQQDVNRKGCTVIEPTTQYSKTAKKIASFFQCTLAKGDTDIYDILIELGDREKQWEVNKSDSGS